MAEIDKNLGQEEVKQQEENPTAEEKINALIAELSELKAQNAKQKNALDKALKNNGDLTKQLRAKMSADEQEEEAKREEAERQKEYLGELETFQRKTLAKDRYLAQGMKLEMATLAADAEINGNYDELSNIQKQFSEEMLNEAKAQWLASRPQLQNGSGTETSVTKEQFMKMGYESRAKFKAEHPDVYKKYTNRE